MIGGGRCKPRWLKANRRASIISRAQLNLSRHGPPAPTGSGRRTAKSTGTTHLPSPMTTTTKRPSMPESTRCCCPLHQRPTNPSCSPYLWKTESSTAHVHCQRLWVAALLSATWRQSGTNTSSTTLSVAIPGGILTKKKRKDTHGCSCQSRCIARVGGLFVDLQGALSSSRSSSRLGTLLDGAADAAAQQKLRYPGSSRSRHP